MLQLLIFYQTWSFMCPILWNRIKEKIIGHLWNSVTETLLIHMVNCLWTCAVIKIMMIYALFFNVQAWWRNIILFFGFSLSNKMKEENIFVMKYSKFCWKVRWTSTLLIPFKQWVFSLAILRIMISLVELLNTFAVCITINTIPIFQNSFLFLFLCFYYASLLYLLLYISLCECIHLYFHSLIILVSKKP